MDSLDSILMLYAYASPSTSTAEGKMAFFLDAKIPASTENEVLINDTDAEVQLSTLDRPTAILDETEASDPVKAIDASGRLAGVKVDTREPSAPQGTDLAVDSALQSGRGREIVEAKTHVMSTLSITLTLLSIIVALRYVLTTHLVLRWFTHKHTTHRHTMTSFSVYLRHHHNAGRRDTY